MDKDCKRCQCIIFERKVGCGCACHKALNILLEMNHGSKERTLRDLEAENSNMDSIFDRAFKIPGVGIGIPMDVSEVIDLLKGIKSKSRGFPGEVKVGTAIEGSDTSQMSAVDLIDYEIYIGIRRNVLRQGFTIDKDSKEELVRVVHLSKPEERVPVCIAYLQGYNKGYRFGVLNERYNK